MKHVVVFTGDQIKRLSDGQLKYHLRLLKKRPDFLNKLQAGDIVYFRKSRREVLGQFEVGKLIISEKLEAVDWSWIKEIGKLAGFDLTKEEFKELINKKRILLIIQITNLEQFITPPIEINKRSKKEWIIID